MRDTFWILLGLAVTYSPTPYDAVPSALRHLTAGFGMDPGVLLVLWPPNLIKSKDINAFFIQPSIFLIGL